jgi:hypothetical protein
MRKSVKAAFEIPDQMVFIITTLESNHKTSIHANLIVVNKKQRRIDGFDPFGKACDAEFREACDLQEFIIREFMCEYDTEQEYAVCCETTKVGIQVTDPMKKREGMGFCRIWVCLAAQLCAENPDKTLRQIVATMTEFGGNTTNICRGFLDEMRDGAVQTMREQDANFSKLYLEVREAPVQSGKAKSAYRFSEKRTMQYLVQIARKLRQ